MFLLYHESVCESVGCLVAVSVMFGSALVDCVHMCLHAWTESAAALPPSQA